jgi:hypothetical protein
MAALAACMLVLGGCAATGTPGGGLNPSWPAAATPAPAADGRAASITMPPWTDARQGAPGRRLGRADAAVFGLHDPELRLARDATVVVADAVRERLSAHGLAVVAATQPADLRLDGVLQALTLNVAGRDERRVAVQATLRRQSDGMVLWSALLEDRDDRFAGVSGNTMSDLERYLGQGIVRVATQLADNVHNRAVPASAAPVASQAAVPAPAAPLAAAPGGTGFVAITSLPTRVKVYVDDVYHGLTPITLELPPGVSQLHFKLDGYRSTSEKVAVRRGVTTELELRLDR